jgi:hypothetical protein
MTDSAADCGPAYDNVQYVHLAFQSTYTDFPKTYFSKRDMMYGQSLVPGGFCMSNGHTLEPLNHVFFQRMMNIMCNDEQPGSSTEAEIPVCFDVTGYEYQCFQTSYDGYQWMANIHYVCPVSYLIVPNSFPDNYCPATEVSEAATRQLPVCPALLSLSSGEQRSTPSSLSSVAAQQRSRQQEQKLGAGGGGEPSDAERRSAASATGFNVFVYLIGALCLLCLVYDSIQEIASTTTTAAAGGGGTKKRKTSGSAACGEGSKSINTRTVSVQPCTSSSEGVCEFAPAPTPAPGGFPLTTSSSSSGDVRGGSRDKGDLTLQDVDFVEDEQRDAEGGAGLVQRDQQQRDQQGMGPGQDLESNGGAVSSGDVAVPAAASVRAPSDGDKEAAEPSGSVYSRINAFFSFLPLPRPHSTAISLSMASLRRYFTLPEITRTDRFDAIGFARFLASVHIVLGHMYQGDHLGTFGGFNKFGFTWVPWFFMLSGF